jgi:hypothetical protein
VRYLFVYHDFAARAQDLISRLGVVDVSIIIARKGEKQPSDEDLERIGHGKPAGAACQIHRKFKQAITPMVNLQYESKIFRIEDKQLESWLLNTKGSTATPIPSPTLSFKECSKDSPHLLFATQALARADEIDPSRWPFIHKAARLLARYADGEAVGPMREWKALHGVEFAPNGRIRYGGHPPSKFPPTEWHLKEGDRTTAELAARIYFDHTEHDGADVVIVFYVRRPPDFE